MIENLRRLHSEVIAADAAAKTARARRDDAIRAAVAKGISRYQIAKALGLSGPAVQKIVKAR